MNNYNITGTKSLNSAYILTANIDMVGYASPSTSIGLFTGDSFPPAFRGYFNGNGYTITIGKTLYDFTGLFGYIGEGGSVKNLKVVYAKDPSDALGRIYTSFSGVQVGGICGLLNGGTIENCTATFAGITSIFLSKLIYLLKSFTSPLLYQLLNSSIMN